jgi:hypothetical protein
VARTNAWWRLRDNLIGRLMPTETLNQILATHRRDPAQRLYIFGWRHGPENTPTVYDMDLPRRKGIPEECTRGRGHTDWWINSHVTNIAGDWMAPYDTEHRGVRRIGYKVVLLRLLADGCIVPSACLDDWLGDDSRKFCPPELRMRWIRN